MFAIRSVFRQIRPIDPLKRQICSHTVMEAVKQPQWHPPAQQTPREGLKLYNSLTRSKSAFVPMEGNKVTWYCCGPTVYDSSHMGHARNYVSTDINRRLLQDYFGYDVLFVQNVTDIDDKIIVRGRQQHLFQQFVADNKTVTPELLQRVLASWSSFASEKLGYTDDVKDFAAFVEKDTTKLKATEDAKFKMNLASAAAAAVALTNKSVAVGDFFPAVKDVLVLTLDQEKGSTVTDHEIFRELSAFWEGEFDKDMAKLNVLPPSVTTRVSEYVPEIVEYVEKIIANGYAYVSSSGDGSVYFDTQSFDKSHDYAKLQPWNKGHAELIDEGEGSLSAKSGKKSSSDFALWKASKPGEPFWDSPWGQGRPGWHIECSVMASAILGPQMDIHSGGIDLAFPHHDNELAQSEAHYDCKQWVNYFLHTGHLHIEGQKMSKSLKNFITIDEALETYTSRQLRLAFALQQWNNQLDFKAALISEVKSIESTFSKFFAKVRALKGEVDTKVAEGVLVSKKTGKGELQLLNSLSDAKEAVHIALCDNLGTPGAIQTLVQLVGKVNMYLSETPGAQVRTEILADVATYISKMFNILGFRTRSDNLGWTEETSESSSEALVMPYLTTLRNFRDDIRNKAMARAAHMEFLQATDQVRFDLLKQGVSLDDRGVGEPALIKMLSDSEKQELITAQEEKEKRAAEKAAKREIQALLEAKKVAERQAKAKIAPKDLFLEDPAYSKFDEETGIPTHDKDGEPISKSLKKKLTKQHEAQKKLYHDYEGQILE